MAKHHHFAPANPETRSVSTWGWFDYLHIIARILVTTTFFHWIIVTLSDIEVVIATWVAAGCPPDLAPVLVLVALALAVLGSAAFVASMQPLGTGLLLLFLLPVVSTDVLAVLSHPLHSPAFIAATSRLLKDVSIAAALVVLACYESHVQWLDSERRDEIKQALLDWYAKQDAIKAAGGAVDKPQLQQAADRPSEPKKVK